MEKLTSDDFLKPRIYKLKDYNNEQLLATAYMIHINALSKINQISSITFEDALRHLQITKQIISTDYAFNKAIKSVQV